LHVVTLTIPEKRASSRSVVIIRNEE